MRVLVTGGGGQLGGHCAPPSPTPRCSHRRGPSSTSPTPRRSTRPRLPARPGAARRRLDQRRRRRGRPRGCAARERRRLPPRRPGRSARQAGRLLDRLRLRRHAGDGYVESDPPGAARSTAPRSSPASGAAGEHPAPTWCARLGVRPGGATTSCARCCGSAASATSRWSTTSAAAPPTPATWPRPPASCSSLPARHLPPGRRRRLQLVRAAGAIVADAGLDARVEPMSSAELDRPAPRPACSILRSEHACTPRLPHWREGLRACLAALDHRLRRPSREADPGHGRLRLHRLALRPPHARRRAATSRWSNLDKLTYAGNPANLADVGGDARTASCTATSPTPRPWPGPPRASTRSSTSPPRPTSTARSSSAGRVHQTDVLGMHVLLEHAARARRPAACTSRPTRSTATSRRARLDARSDAAAAVVAVLGRRRPAATCRCSPPCAPTASTR